MDDHFAYTPPDSPDEYLQLIDDERKAYFRAAPFVCVNFEKDIWQRLETIPLEVLKRVAVECLTIRLQKLQPNPPFVVLREGPPKHD